MALRTRVWAHRGASGYAPENTFEAFRMAVDMGADGVELDVQLTKDRRPVVIHDETIDRVSDGSGRVADHTLRELKSYNYNKMHPGYDFAAIPTLDEVYQWLKYTDLTINVELKTGLIFYDGIEALVLDMAKQMRMENRILYSSFNHYSVMKIKELDSEAKTGLLYSDGFIDVAEYGRKVGADALHPAYNYMKYPGFLQSCRDRGMPIHVWTVNEESCMRELYEADVDAVITNYPDRAVSVRKEFT